MADDAVAISRQLSLSLAGTKLAVWLRIGILQEDMDDPERALGAYERALSADPTNVNAVTRVGILLSRKERHAQAITYLLEAVRADPLNEPAWRALGFSYIMSGEVEKAYYAYATGLATSTDLCDPLLWFGIGLAYDRLGLLDKALHSFRTVEDLSPSFEKLHEVYYLVGVIHKEQGNYNLARSYFSKITGPVATSSEAAEVSYQIGTLHELAGDTASAMNAYAAALEINEDHVQCLQSMGWLLFSTCNSPESRKYLQRAIQKDPTDGNSHYLLGRILMGNGECRVAYERYQKAVRLDGQNAYYWCSIAALYYQMQQHRDALDAYSRAIQIDPSIAEIWFDMGTLYELHGQFPDAVDSYHRAVQLQPRNDRFVKRLTAIENTLAGGVPPPPPTGKPASDRPEISPTLLLARKEFVQSEVVSTCGPLPSPPDPLHVERYRKAHMRLPTLRATSGQEAMRFFKPSSSWQPTKPATDDGEPTRETRRISNGIAASANGVVAHSSTPVSLTVQECAMTGTVRPPQNGGLDSVFSRTQSPKQISRSLMNSAREGLRQSAQGTAYRNQAPDLDSPYKHLPSLSFSPFRRTVAACPPLSSAPQTASNDFAAGRVDGNLTGWSTESHKLEPTNPPGATQIGSRGSDQFGGTTSWQNGRDRALVAFGPGRSPSRASQADGHKHHYAHDDTVVQPGAQVPQSITIAGSLARPRSLPDQRAGAKRQLDKWDSESASAREDVAISPARLSNANEANKQQPADPEGRLSDSSARRPSSNGLRRMLGPRELDSTMPITSFCAHGDESKDSTSSSHPRSTIVVAKSEHIPENPDWALTESRSRRCADVQEIAKSGTLGKATRFTGDIRTITSAGNSLNPYVIPTVNSDDKSKVMKVGVDEHAVDEAMLPRLPPLPRRQGKLSPCRSNDRTRHASEGQRRSRQQIDNRTDEALNCGIFGSAGRRTVPAHTSLASTAQNNLHGLEMNTGQQSDTAACDGKVVGASNCAKGTAYVHAPRKQCSTESSSAQKERPSDAHSKHGDSKSTPPRTTGLEFVETCTKLRRERSHPSALSNDIGDERSRLARHTDLQGRHTESAHGKGQVKMGRRAASCEPSVSAPSWGPSLQPQTRSMAPLSLSQSVEEDAERKRCESTDKISEQRLDERRIGAPNAEPDASRLSASRNESIPSAQALFGSGRATLFSASLPKTGNGVDVGFQSMKMPLLNGTATVAEKQDEVGGDPCGESNPASARRVLHEWPLRSGKRKASSFGDDNGRMENTEDHEHLLPKSTVTSPAVKSPRDSDARRMGSGQLNGKRGPSQRDKRGFSEEGELKRSKVDRVGDRVFSRREFRGGGL